jgi:GT2 family glycosyltransferase
MEGSRSRVAPLVSVVIVTWNAPRELEACLASLAAQTDRDFETIVVDNGTGAGSAAWVRSACPAVRLLEAGTNLGFAGGCNLGIAASSGLWIATLNDDAQADPGWVASLRRAIAEAPARMGMIQSRLLQLGAPERIASTGVVLRSDGCFEDRDAGRPVGTGPPQSAVFCPCAAAALYRREMLDDVAVADRIFDDAYFAYFEDVDLGWRARLAGWDALYRPDATAWHAEHASARRQVPGFVARQCRRNRVRTLLKNASLALLAASVPRLLRDGAAELRWGPRELGAWLAAAADGLRKRRSTGRRARIARRAVERCWVERREPPVLGSLPSPRASEVQR